MMSIGIDPGKGGAIVVALKVGDEIQRLSYVIPLLGKQVDRQALNNILREYKGNECHVWIEDVHAIFNSSAKSTFSFGHVCGLLEMAVVANGYSYTLVQPKVWQKEMWQGIPEQRKPSTKEGKKGPIDTKLMSLMACKRLFPNEDLTKSAKSKKDHDGIVDAMLLAEYGLRKKL